MKTLILICCSVCLMTSLAYAGDYEQMIRSIKPSSNSLYTYGNSYYDSSADNARMKADDIESAIEDKINFNNIIRDNERRDRQYNYLITHPHTDPFNVPDAGPIW